MSAGKEKHLFGSSFGTFNKNQSSVLSHISFHVHKLGMPIPIYLYSYIYSLCGSFSHYGLNVGNI